MSERLPQQRERHLQIVDPPVCVGITKCLVPAPSAFDVTHGLIELRSASGHDTI
jgi:hypothetical protein